MTLGEFEHLLTCTSALSVSSTGTAYSYVSLIVFFWLTGCSFSCVLAVNYLSYALDIFSPIYCYFPTLWCPSDISTYIFFFFPLSLLWFLSYFKKFFPISTWSPYFGKFYSDVTCLLILPVYLSCIRNLFLHMLWCRILTFPPYDQLIILAPSPFLTQLSFPPESRCCVLSITCTPGSPPWPPVSSSDPLVCPNTNHLWLHPRVKFTTVDKYL